MFRDEDHPRDGDGKFTDGSGRSEREKTISVIRKYSSDPAHDLEHSDSSNGKRFTDVIQKGRIKVGEITNPIYDDMVLSNGRRVKDIVTRAVEMPLTGSAGAEHIENHSERKGFVGKYIGFMSEIINDPDYVFEDKSHENTILIEKKVDENVIMVVNLNFDNIGYTNTVITMRSEDSYSFRGTIKNYEKNKKVLYKKQIT